MIGISLGTEILFFKYLREIPEIFLGINTSPVIIWLKADLNDSSKDSLFMGLPLVNCLYALSLF